MSRRHAASVVGRVCVNLRLFGAGRPDAADQRESAPVAGRVVHDGRGAVHRDLGRRFGGDAASVPVRVADVRRHGRVAGQRERAADHAQPAAVRGALVLVDGAADHGRRAADRVRAAAAVRAGFVRDHARVVADVQLAGVTYTPPPPWSARFERTAALPSTSSVEPVSTENPPPSSASQPDTLAASEIVADEPATSAAQPPCAAAPQSRIRAAPSIVSADAPASGAAAVGRARAVANDARADQVGRRAAVKVDRGALRRRGVRDERRVAETLSEEAPTTYTPPPLTLASFIATLASSPTSQCDFVSSETPPPDADAPNASLSSTRALPTRSADAPLCR